MGELDDWAQYMEISPRWSDGETLVTKVAKYQCRRCGERFEVAILTEREKRDAERERKPIFAIQCPKCHSQDVKRI